MEDAENKHYDKMTAILVKYAKSTKDSKTKLDTYAQEDKNKKIEALDENAKAAEKDLLDSQRYLSAKEKQILDANKKMRDITEQMRLYSQGESQGNKDQDRNVRKASYFNPLQALFKGGTETPGDDIRDAHHQAEEHIANLKANAAAAGDRLSDAQVSQSKSQNKVNSDQKEINLSGIPFIGEAQKQKHTENRELNKKNLDELDSATKDYNEKQKSASDAVNKYTLDKLTEKQKQEVKIAEATFDSTTKIANAAFNAQQKRIQQHMDDLKNMYSFELTLAGNNSGAKVRIAVEEEGKMKAMRRQAAESQKAQAEFSAVTNTAVAITQALTAGPYIGVILAAIVGAAGLYEIDKIASAPLPSYAVGRKGGKAEVARINEQGFEIKEDKFGNKSILGGGKEAIVKLDEGDIIHTHTESDKMMQDLLKGTGAYLKHEKNENQTKIIAIQGGLTKADYKDAMKEALRELPQTIIEVPARGVEERLRRTQEKNGIGLNNPFSPKN